MIQEFVSNNLQWFIPMIVDALLMTILFLPKFRIFLIKSSPEKVIKCLAYKLRTEQYRVEERPRYLMVRIGRWSAVEIYKVTKADETKIFYRASATPAGWSTTIILIMMTTVHFLIGIISIIVILYIYLRDRQFIYRHITPLRPVDGILPDLTPNDKDEINIKLLTGLSEGYRLASEAYEAEQRSRQNYQALVLIGVLLAWLTVFPFFIFVENSSTAQLWNTIRWALLWTIAFTIFLLWFIRRWFHPRLQQYHRWSERLRERLSLEVSGKVPKDEPTSTFETLAETSREIPAWVKSIRRKGLNLDPGTELLIQLALGTSFLVFTLFFLMIIFGNVFAAVLFGAAGTIVGIISYMYYRTWKQRWKETTTQTLNKWKKQYDDLRLKMEQYLQDL